MYGGGCVAIAAVAGSSYRKGTVLPPSANLMVASLEEKESKLIAMQCCIRARIEASLCA